MPSPKFLAALLVVAGCSSCHAQEAAPVRTASAEKSQSAGRIDDELALRRIADGAYVAVHEPFFASNVLVVRMPDGTVVICSSPYETVGTRALVRWVKATMHPTKIVDINTHFHFDGTGGNEAYRELGVETYASKQTQELLAKEGKKMQDEAAEDFEKGNLARVRAMAIVPADHTFDEHDGLALNFGGEEVRVIYPGPAHAPDNVVVLFPARGILFGGCMIKGTHAVGYMGDADLDHWPAAVAAVRHLGANVVVPGHGPIGGIELFDLTLDVVAQAQREKAHPH